MVATNLSTASEVSKQVEQYLLCQECEIRLQQGGENWVLGRRLMPSGAFPFEKLYSKRRRPVHEMDLPFTRWIS